MFDTTMIGKKIKQARINQNMTQMNLADAMGVSYQAVSNWERGNSMPDISKLADLCRALHISVNELLGIESTAVTKAMAQEELTMEELSEVAPVLPPKVIMEQSKRENKKLSLRRIAYVVPFLDEENLDQLIENSDLSDLDGLDEIAPFLSKSALDHIITRCIESGNLDNIEELAPFLDKETLNRVVDTIIASNLNVDMGGLYPFLSEETLHILAKRMMENQDLEALKEIAPFV